MSRVCKTPSEFPAGFYWNGGQRINYGTYPCWINDISLENDDDTNSQEHTRYLLPEVGEARTHDNSGRAFLQGGSNVAGDLDYVL